MKSYFHHILPLLATPVLAALVFVSCADEQVDDADDDLEIVATAQWKCGRTMAGRAGTGPITVNETDYPTLLHITVGDGDHKQRPASHPPTFIIGKTSGANDTQGYTAYHDQYRAESVRFDASGLFDAASSTKALRPLYSKSVINGLSVEANTLSPRSTGSGNIPQAWDDTDITTASHIDHLTTKAEFGGEALIEGKHLLLTLGHVNAMLRLYFKVSEEYAKVRHIDLRSISIAGSTIMTDARHILTTTFAEAPVCNAYIKPANDHTGNIIPTSGWSNAVSATTPITFQCTYDIYDKDGTDAAGGHLTREGVVATNTVTLNRLMSNGTPVGQIRAGYYYDLYITINPDYLYVLSEHDNKHMTIQ